jgi:hypothetical protein
MTEKELIAQKACIAEVDGETLHGRERAKTINRITHQPRSLEESRCDAGESEGGPDGLVQPRTSLHGYAR